MLLLNNKLRFITFFIIILSLQGCATFSSFYWNLVSPLEESIERNEFSVTKGGDVIGRLALISPIFREA
ncbi:MAG: hypothetical protein ACPL1G_05525 [Thermodesulfovibrionales bacterium]